MTARIVAFVLVTVALIGLLVYHQTVRPPDVVSGFIEADEIRVGSRVGGRVAEVFVDEGQRTSPGEVLLRLEPFDLLERQAEARARLEAAEAESKRLETGFRTEEVAQAEAQRDQLAAGLAELKAGPRKQTIAAAAARLTAARSDLKLAESSFARTERLFKQGAATQVEMDRASDQKSASAAAVIVREQELAELEEGTRAESIAQAEAQLREAEQMLALRRAGYRAEEVDAARATRDAAAAALRAIDRQIAELEIRAPAEGVVEALDLQPGDLVGAGTPVLSLIDVRRLWVRAYVPENRLDVRVGQPVRVTVDSYPGESFAARITFISRQAEFTPSNIQTPEERVKQVFRIKVELEEGKEKLRPGMAADVNLTEE